MPKSPLSDAGISRRTFAAQGIALAAVPSVALATTAGVIRFGQSAPSTGPAQHLGIEYRRGLELAFEEVNAGGGVNGQRVELINYDDMYEPEMAMSNTTDLLEADKVFALLGYVGTESINRCLPQVIKAGVPFVAPLSGAEALRRNPARWMFHLRPSLSTECGLIARTLATMGFQRVCVLQQDDADGAAGTDALQAALRTVGLPPPEVISRVTRNSTGMVEWEARDTQAAARELLRGQPQALVFMAAYASTAAVLRAARQLGYRGGAFATSLSSSTAIVPLLGPAAAGLSVTQVMPSPADVARRVVQGYQRRLRASGHGSPDYVSLEGWVVGQVVVEALRRVGRNPSREAFMLALESLEGVDLGGLTLGWDSRRRQALSQVAMTVLDSTGRALR